MFSHLQPVGEVIAHVISAKGEHGHGIAAQGADFGGDGSGGFAAGGGSEESSVLPIERFGDEGNDAAAASAEKNGVDGHAFGIFPFGRDYGALAGAGSKPGIGMGCRAARLGGPRATKPID